MVTLVHTTDSIKQATATATPAIPPAANRQIDWRLKVTEALQTTLELEELLETWFEQLGHHVEFSGLCYTNKAIDTEIRLGRQCLHQCHYNLEKDGASLGTLIISHNKHFPEGELEIIEQMLAPLACPLRNALKYREAVQMAHRDPLTGAGNRLAMNSALNREIDLARRYHQPFSMLVMDIDRFKEINDTYGHTAGDHVLKSVAQRIAKGSRRTDMLFRYGGEEFVVLLNKTDEAGAAIIGERIRKLVDEEVIRYHDENIETSISIGAAAINNSDNALSLFGRADKALYYAKENGRNQMMRAEELLEKLT
jgi:diguanylate cyclase (GGDEF)-like protein